MVPTRCLGLIAVLAITGAAAAQTPPPACSDEKSHDFDFWIGEWDVYSGDQLAGTNSIRPILDGCVLQETWAGATGAAGSSFNFYNPATKQWQQFWVWRNGTTLEVAGGHADGKMHLTGTSKDPQGNDVQHRITWYDNENGTVRQHWEASRDGGKTWTTAFDGLYKRRTDS